MTQESEREDALDATAPPGTPPTAPVARTRRRWPLVLVTILGLAGLIGLLSILSVAGIRTDLIQARAAMARGADRLLDGEAEAAATEFRDGLRRFESAARRADGFGLRILRRMPILGRTPDAIGAISEAGVTTAEAALLVAEAVAEVPGGAAGLAPSDGAIPLEPLPALAETAGEAEALANQALARIRDAPDGLLIGPVASARRTAEEELTEFHHAVHAAAQLLDGLPHFLGSEEPQRYFFGAQNPAELRGTGGLIGAYSLLTIDRGRFDFSPFRPIQSLPIPDLDTVPVASADYEANYQSFRGGGRFWTAINIMPDLPSVGATILRSFEAATGEPLDGVILADPFALEALLRATGAVEIPDHGVEVDASTVVTFTTNEAYSVFTDSASRKRILGDVARVAFERFLAKPSTDLGDLRVLLRAAADRHILVYSADDSMQEGLEASGVGGALAPPQDPDVVSVVVNSAAGVKVDYYQHRVVTQTVVLADDGSATVEFQLRLQNSAPVSGQPGYVIGPIRPTGRDQPVGEILESVQAGDSVALVNLYCGIDCVPRDAQLDGEGLSTAVKNDLGVRYLQHYYRIAAGEEAVLDVSWLDPEAWQGNSSGGRYRMTFAGQTTIIPTMIAIRIEPPEGMNIVAVNEPLSIVDGAVVYEGTANSRMEFAVDFAPGTPARLWQNIVRFLTSPVF